ncbi:uncharacterized protein LOC111111250 [Crassostrea virginica]
MVWYLASLLFVLSAAIVSARTLDLGCRLPDGHWYEVGTTKVISCSQCTCVARGRQSCIYICPGCEYKKINYPVGETFRDGCIVCMCQRKQQVICSSEECL